MDLFDLFQEMEIQEIKGQIEQVKVNDKLSKNSQQEYFLKLSSRIDKLVLVNQAVIEILSQKLGITYKEIAGKMNEIDMRDGVKDGKYTPPPKDCPKCKAKICRDFHRCLFCGYKDSDPDNLHV